MSIKLTPALSSTELRLLTADEVASLLRLSRSSVYKLSRTRRLPSISVTRSATRSTRRWRESDVLEFMDANRDE